MGKEAQQPDLGGLEALALGQGGYFDRQDALARGVSDRLLTYYVRTGRFERVFPGVYRLHAAPFTPHDDLLLAWVWSNYRGAVSHESALALYGLSDVMPSRVQLTVPPSFRRSGAPFDLHRSELSQADLTTYEGVQVTTPARSIVDAASAGLDHEQVTKAVEQALARALATPEQLLRAAGRGRYRNRRTVQPLVDTAIAHATA